MVEQDSPGTSGEHKSPPEQSKASPEEADLLRPQNYTLLKRIKGVLGSTMVKSIVLNATSWVGYELIAATGGIAAVATSPFENDITKPVTIGGIVGSALILLGSAWLNAEVSYKMFKGDIHASPSLFANKTHDFLKTKSPDNALLHKIGFIVASASLDIAKQAPFVVAAFFDPNFMIGANTTGAILNFGQAGFDIALIKGTSRFGKKTETS